MVAIKQRRTVSTLKNHDIFTASANHKKKVFQLTRDPVRKNGSIILHYKTGPLVDKSVTKHSTGTFIFAPEATVFLHFRKI